MTPGHFLTGTDFEQIPQNLSHAVSGNITTGTCFLLLTLLSSVAWNYHTGAAA